MTEARRRTYQGRSFRGIDDETWALLAGMARMRQITIGEFLTGLIRQEAERVLGPLEKSEESAEKATEVRHGSND